MIQAGPFGRCSPWVWTLPLEIENNSPGPFLVLHSRGEFGVAKMARLQVS